MAAPKGNKNGCGKKGRSGRKSMYQELQDAQALWDLWTGEMSREQVEKTLKDKKKVGLFHVFAAKAHGGDMKAINKLLDKLYANKSEITQEIKQEIETIEISKEKQKQIDYAINMIYENKDDN